MFLFYFSIGLVILSFIFYHIFQKSISGTVHPVISLIVTYISALVISLIILPFYPTKANIVGSFKELNWASYTLGIAIVGLEIGYLLAYRSGWDISLASIFSSAIVAVLLVPIGLLLFKEQISIQNIIGIIFCLIGIILISQK